MSPCRSHTPLSYSSDFSNKITNASCSDSFCHPESKINANDLDLGVESSRESCREHRHGYLKDRAKPCIEKSHRRHGTTCCAGTPKRILSPFLPKTTPCSDNTICVRTIADPTVEIESNSMASDLYPKSRDEIIRIDDPSTESEKIVLRVQGMTCTGCEANLQKVLGSIGAISNVKTSLLLSQAGFDLSPSATYNSDNIAWVVEQMTGFKCTKTSHAGEELELLLPPATSTLEGPWPKGLLTLSSLGREKVRISYLPEVVGARVLLQHPFFQSSQFAPAPCPPAVSSGRAEAYGSFLLTALSAILTIPVLVLAYANLPNQHILHGSVSLVLATLVQVLVGRMFYVKAYKSLRYSGMIEMDMLVVLSTTAAYVYSVVAFSFLAAGKPLSTGEFFETSTLLVTLIMVGRTTAAYARQKAIESMSMESLQVQTAIVVDPENPEVEETIDARLLQYGDVFKVRPEMRIVTDGTILEGETEVDESLVTGEAMLLGKSPGMAVIAGSVNHSGTLLVKLTQLPSENTIKQISTMVDEAKSSKTKIQEIADQMAGHFTPAIIAITAIVFFIWVMIGKKLRSQSTSTACINAMTFAISTLIVSCPCAIGLAVPMVLVIAGGVGAKYGLMIKSASTLEIGRKVSHVIFDKTGTLTQGEPSVVDATYLNESEAHLPGALQSAILGLVSNSKHPISRGIERFLRAQAVESAHLEQIVSVPGKGIRASCGGVLIRAGSPEWLQVEALPAIQILLQRNLTIFCVEIGRSLSAVFGLEDQLRPDALATITELKRRSIDISLLSGDNAKAVIALGQCLGIRLQNTRFSYSPSQKAAYVKAQLAVKNSTVLFCGDGTNDAVALAQASIGVHMNGGTDVAQSAADVVLMNTSLWRVVTLIELSRAFYRRVVFNFVWSAVYNVLAILFAAGAFPRVRIPPAYAGLGELVSVVPVIGVAVLLRWKKF